MGSSVYPIDLFQKFLEIPKNLFSKRFLGGVKGQSPCDSHAERDVHMLETKNTVAYQCPCCGAGLGFDPEKGKFACEFCLSKFTEEELSATDSAEKAKKAEKQHDTAYKSTL